MDSLERLTELFKRFPGVGLRQSRRFVYHLLSLKETDLEEMSSLIRDLRSGISQCTFCFRYFKGRPGVCDICSHSEDKESVMVVEKDIDLENIKRMGAFKGRFFVLGGIIPILEDAPAKRIRIKELITLLEKESLKELVLALSVTPEGENTIQYIKQTLTPLATKKGFHMTELGRGLSTGTELEYSDKDTLIQALKNRA